MNEQTELQKAVELLPCPFCGANPVIKQAGTTRYWWVGCEIHLSEEPRGCGVSRSAYEKQEAIDRWNTRPAAKQLEALQNENKELKNAIQLLEHGKYGRVDLTAQILSLQQERDSLKSVLKQCGEALEYVKGHEHIGFDESNSHYNQFCPVCVKVKKALSSPLLTQIMSEKE